MSFSIYLRNERTYRCLSQRWPSSQRRLVELRASGGTTGSRSATTGTYATTVATALGLTIITGLVRAHGQVAPARHPLQADRDDGPFGDLHRRQLAVPRA